MQHNEYHPEPGVTVTLNSINTKQLVRDLSKLKDSAQKLRMIVMDGIIYQSTGYKSKNVFANQKRQQKVMMQLLDKIQKDLTGLYYKTFIENVKRAKMIEISDSLERKEKKEGQGKATSSAA